ncbi:hypothetical protein [Methylocystis sp. B8]|uniref:hypothetical protein n=1 Tax=Methylocystis sp. B8 TaxID=544938 RepID=UPI0010FCFEF2|nr:hypothetical protein [Methylocystis sp. B8]TLG78604.1 hypothetical protein FEV16_00745 [Methylocystis sp. B8]
MSGKRRTIEIHIVMTESGNFVVDDDANAAAERAEEEFPDDDVRQVALTIELQPPSAMPQPIAKIVRID